VGLRGGSTVPLERHHVGPLRLLKGFRHAGPADGADSWEQIVIHPPGGIAAGDSLHLDIGAGPGSHLLLTSPGAAKWYRGRDGATADQILSLHAAAGAHLEWLPMETIVYDGARAVIENNLRVAAGASLVAAELTCLGRPAGNRPFVSGCLSQTTRLTIAGRLAYTERLRLEGADRSWRGMAGLGPANGYGSMLLVPPAPEAVPELLRDVREAIDGTPGESAATALPGLVVVRWRGERAEHGWTALRAAWAAARPRINGRAPVPPRIWSC
jgi:urease accessory protein